jgi:ribosomal-protein-alanine acetyltransferase
MPEDSRPPPPGRFGLALREARPTDIDALARLEAECFSSDRLSRRSLASLARSPSASLLVASRADDPIGYAALLLRRGAHSARLYSIAIHPQGAGQGIGSQLLRAAEHEARRRGATRMHLEVRADNSAAVRFYVKSGYRATGRRPGYYEDGETALLFARELPAPEADFTPARRLGQAA